MFHESTSARLGRLLPEIEQWCDENCAGWLIGERVAVREMFAGHAVPVMVSVSIAYVAFTCQAEELLFRLRWARALMENRLLPGPVLLDNMAGFLSRSMESLTVSFDVKGMSGIYMLVNETLLDANGVEDRENRKLLPEVQAWCEATLRSHRLTTQSCTIRIFDPEQPGKSEMESADLMFSFVLFENEADRLLFRLRWLDKD